jgi:NAD(P)-dependent dehydrogenase (short-subunit alcohol dehydrogenase family)
MPRVLITGANRGLGLEFTRQYAGRGWHVVATCRQPEAAGDLRQFAHGHPKVSVAALDVTDHAQVDRLAAGLQAEPIDLLLLNSAFLGPQQAQKCGTLDYELFERSFAANVTGPMKTAEAFIPHVQASTIRKIVFLGSAAGSLTLLRPPQPLCLPCQQGGPAPGRTQPGN